MVLFLEVVLEDVWYISPPYRATPARFSATQVPLTNGLYLVGWVSQESKPNQKHHHRTEDNTIDQQTTNHTQQPILYCLKSNERNKINI